MENNLQDQNIPPVQPQPLKNTRWLTILILLLIGIILLMIGFYAGVMFTANKDLSEATPTPIITPTATPTLTDQQGTPTVSPKGEIGNYINKPGSFSLVLPTGYKYCEDNFCQDDGIAGNGFYFSRFPLETGIIKNILEIEFAKNSLGMSAIEFAKRSISLGRQYSVNCKNAYSQEKDSVFAGEEAYKFIATGCFEQYGNKLTGEGWENAPEFFKSAGEGRMLAVPVEVIYLDHNGLIYRIIYSPDNDITKEIIESFKFTK